MTPSELGELLKNGGITGAVLLVLYLIIQGVLVVGGSHKEQMKGLQDRIDALVKQVTDVQKEKDAEIDQLRQDKELEIARLIDRNNELWDLIKLSRGLVQASKATADQAVGDAERAISIARRKTARGGER